MTSSDERDITLCRAMNNTIVLSSNQLQTHGTCMRSHDDKSWRRNIASRHRCNRPWYGDGLVRRLLSWDTHSQPHGTTHDVLCSSQMVGDIIALATFIFVLELGTVIAPRGPIVCNRGFCIYNKLDSSRLSDDVIVLISKRLCREYVIRSPVRIVRNYANSYAGIHFLEL